MKHNGRKYRRMMAAWLKNRRGRSKPVASKRQGAPIRKKRARRN